MSELLPCPFCGSDDIEFRSGDRFASCRKCDASSPWFSANGDIRKNAIAAWNRRPVTEAAVSPEIQLGGKCITEAAPSSPAWVELARLVAEAEGQFGPGSIGRNVMQDMIDGCRRVIRLAQQEAAPSDIAWECAEHKTFGPSYLKCAACLMGVTEAAPGGLSEAYKHHACFCSAHQDCRAGALAGCGMCAKAHIESLDGLAMAVTKFAATVGLPTPAPNREAELKVIEALARLDPVVGPFRFQEERTNPLDFDEKPVYTSRRICALCRRRSADNGENVTHTPQCPWILARLALRSREKPEAEKAVIEEEKCTYPNTPHMGHECEHDRARAKAVEDVVEAAVTVVKRAGRRSDGTAWADLNINDLAAKVAALGGGKEA